MKKYFQIVCLLIPFLSVGQERYNGTVYDVGTREPLENVLVRANNHTQSTTSNEDGSFSIVLNSEIDETNNFFSFANNTLYWNINSEASIHIYSVNGARVFNQRVAENGQWEIPVLTTGYYIARIQSTHTQGNILLFSTGSRYEVVEKKNSIQLAALESNSLHFSKQGYFDRESSVEDPQLFEHYNLLKTEYENLDYFKELLRHEAFEMLQSNPTNSNFSDVHTIKVLYDFVEDEIYYTNVKKYPSHYSFAHAFLGYTGTALSFLHSQYNHHPSRFLNLISINYHANLDKYVFQFSSTDLVDCVGIKETYDKLLQTSYLEGKLFFYANNLRWEECADVPQITFEELYEGQNYQALNLEENYGYLRKIDADTLSTTYLGHHDVILFNSVPNDISVVAGIITTEFQTPLSHINVLSNNRKTPNMALRNGWTDAELNDLVGQLVYLKVEAEDYIIRQATIQEAEAFWNQNEPQTPITLEIDTLTSGLIEMSSADITSVETIGGKGANFAELANLGTIPVPENYFAIPFYYYHKHIKNNGIDVFIDRMLSDPQFESNIVYRQTKLNEIKDLIVDAPLSPQLRSLILSRINNFNEFESFRFRSSTNAEDLEEFSGAGLYESFSAKKNHQTKTIDRAVKRVWASLWNLRAFDEREYYKIDQQSVAMGILVHRSFPDEDANGVVLTTNIYNQFAHGYTVNVQYKEYSIVNPQPGVTHDEFVIHTINLNQGLDYTIEYLGRSNIPELNGETVMTNEEITELAEYCTIIKNHYYDNLSSGNEPYNSFAIDLEFKVDSDVESRKIYIKQSRIYATN